MPNGSFEDTLSCPNGLGEVYKSKNWFDPTNATSDYFNNCSVNNITSLPNNYYGHTNAFHGNSCAGLATFEDSSSSINWREYIGVKLLETTKNNTTYCFTSYIKPAGRFTGFSNNFGIIMLNDTSNICSFYPQNISYPIIANNNNVIFDTLNWTKVCFEFKTNTSFQYLIIGNFFNDKKTVISYTNNSLGYSGAYYYIDSVSLIECSTLIVPNVITANSDGINDVFTIKNLSSNCTLFIYNRWGRLIYKNINYQNDWRPVDEGAGTYYYLLQTETETYKGFLEIFK